MSELTRVQSAVSWSRVFHSDCVVGGTDEWQLGTTGLRITHWRGFFLVYMKEKCLGGIEKHYGVTPRQFFLENNIPFEGTLAASVLNESQEAEDSSVLLAVSA